MNIPLIYEQYHQVEPTLSAYLHLCDKLAEMEQSTFFNLHYSSEVFEKAGVLVRATEPHLWHIKLMAFLN